MTNRHRRSLGPMFIFQCFGLFSTKKADIKIMKKIKLYKRKSRHIERLMSLHSLLKSNSKICQIVPHPCANYNLIKENILPTYFSVSHDCIGFCVSLPSANCFIVVKCKVDEVWDKYEDFTILFGLEPLLTLHHKKLLTMQYIIHRTMRHNWDKITFTDTPKTNLT